MSNKIKPPIRWVGGKTKLLTQIKNHIPIFSGKYFEPFVGGGALLFNLLPSSAVAADSNSELINFYNQIKTNYINVCTEANLFANNLDTFYKIRNLDLAENFKTSSNAHHAARFLYLSKTSFQGLWRVNSKGHYNTSYGKLKNYNIDFNYFKNFSNKIQNIDFICEDFEKTVSSASSNDFVYFDPPYIPISTTSNFTTYTSSGFNHLEQTRLLNVCKDLDKKNVKFILSNSDCEASRELYKDFKIETVSTQRLIAGKASARGKITEILVKNY